MGDKRLADFVSGHQNSSEFLEIKSSDCIATVAEHDQIHMFRDFMSKCGLGLSFTMLVGLYVSAYKNSSPCTDFYGIFLLESSLKFIDVPVCVQVEQ